MNFFKEIYQYLVAGLPEIMLEDKKLSYSLAVFKEEIIANVNNADKKLAELLYLQHDANNTINLLLQNEKAFNKLGNFSKIELQDWIAQKNIESTDEMPASKSAFLTNFIARYKDENKIYTGLNWEDQMVYYLYDFREKNNNRFLQEWFCFEHQFESLQAALIARKYNLQVSQKVYNNSEFSHSLVNSKSKDFGLTAEYTWVDTVIALYEETELLNREYQLDKMKWEKLNDLTVFNYFSIEVVLAYIIKLNIVDRWIKLDEEKGQQIFNSLIEEIQNSYEFPKEFDI